MGFQLNTVSFALNLVVCILLLAWINQLVAEPLENAQTMRIMVPVYPPYTYQKNNQWQGVAFTRAIETLNQAKISYSLLPASNYGAAFKKLKNHQADAVLIASENAERNQYAIFTAPIFCVTWNWYINRKVKYTPDQAGFKLKHKVASAYESNHYFWLNKHNFAAEGIKKLDNIAKMLAANRIDAILASQLVFEETARKSQIELSQFNIVYHSNHPAGMYIDKKYAVQHAASIEQLNQYIRALMPAKSCDQLID